LPLHLVQALPLCPWIITVSLCVLPLLSPVYTAASTILFKVHGLPLLRTLSGSPPYWEEKSKSVQVTQDPTWFGHHWSFWAHLSLFFGPPLSSLPPAT
jgi:hypothetical protein